MKIKDRDNKFLASDWFDINFFGGFLLSDTLIKDKFNEGKYTIGSEKISSRVLNHWCENGIIKDNRPNGKGWSKFSFSEVIWIEIVVKLRNFGLDLKRIKEVKEQLDFYNNENNKSKCPLLDFYLTVALTSKIPIKLIVFESGQANIVRQIDIDLANELECITEDFILIDINKLLNNLLTKKEVKADYLNYNQIPKSPIVKQIEESLSANDIQSIIIKVKDKDYIIDEEFFINDRIKANALMSVLKFGELVEKKNSGKSTFKVTNKKKIEK
jgi:DNA-binding transcriptional MerR regulator